MKENKYPRSVRLYSNRPTSSEKFNGRQRNFPSINWGCAVPLALSICMIAYVIAAGFK